MGQFCKHNIYSRKCVGIWPHAFGWNLSALYSGKWNYWLKLGAIMQLLVPGMSEFPCSTMKIKTLRGYKLVTKGLKGALTK